MADEYLDLIEDGTDRCIGRALRSQCHGDPSLLHRAIRVAVFHPDRQHILLQKRALTKEIFPGRWDMAVGGHVDSGETTVDAAKRETAEELGLKDIPFLKEFYTIKVRNEIESENVQAYFTVSEGPFEFQKEEISEIRFFSLEELALLKETQPEIFTPLLVREIPLLLTSGAEI